MYLIPIFRPRDGGGKRRTSGRDPRQKQKLTSARKNYGCGAVTHANRTTRLESEEERRGRAGTRCTDVVDDAAFYVRSRVFAETGDAE